MNLPNALTILRLHLVPVYLIALLYRRFDWALALFAVAALTDFFDGFFARRLGQKTLLGAYLDPLADKVLVAVSFIALAALGLLPPWLAVVVVAKDLYLAIGAGILYFTGQPSLILPTLLGKMSTALQLLITVGVLFSSLIPLPQPLLQALFWMAGGVTVACGLNYILLGVRSLPPQAESPLE